MSSGETEQPTDSGAETGGPEVAPEQETAPPVEAAEPEVWPPEGYEPVVTRTPEALADEQAERDAAAAAEAAAADAEQETTG